MVTTPEQDERHVPVPTSIITFCLATYCALNSNALNTDNTVNKNLIMDSYFNIGFTEILKNV